MDNLANENSAQKEATNLRRDRRSSDKQKNPDYHLRQYHKTGDESDLMKYYETLKARNSAKRPMKMISSSVDSESDLPLSEQIEMGLKYDRQVYLSHLMDTYNISRSEAGDVYDLLKLSGIEGPKLLDDLKNEFPEYSFTEIAYAIYTFGDEKYIRSVIAVNQFMNEETTERKTLIDTINYIQVDKEVGIEPALIELTSDISDNLEYAENISGVDTEDVEPDKAGKNEDKSRFTNYLHHQGPRNVEKFLTANDPNLRVNLFPLEDNSNSLTNHKPDLERQLRRYALRIINPE